MFILDISYHYLPCSVPFFLFPYNCLSVSVTSCQTFRFAFTLFIPPNHPNNGPRSAEADTSTESFACVGDAHQSIRLYIYLSFLPPILREYVAFNTDVNKLT